MMRWIIGSSLKFRILAVALAAGMMVLGFVQLQKLPVDVFPEFAPPRVEIQTACVGLSAAEVESLVTVPMEAALNGVPGLDDAALEVGGPAVVDRVAVQAGHGPAAGAPGCDGAAGHGDPDAADLGGARRSCSSRCRRPAG